MYGGSSSSSLAKIPKIFLFKTHMIVFLLCCWWNECYGNFFALALFTNLWFFQAAWMLKFIGQLSSLLLSLFFWFCLIGQWTCSKFCDYHKYTWLFSFCVVDEVNITGIFSRWHLPQICFFQAAWTGIFLSYPFIPQLTKPLFVNIEFGITFMNLHDVCFDELIKMDVL